MNILKSEGKKRGLGAWIVMIPMIIKYIGKYSGNEFEINEELLDIVFLIGTTIWTGGAIHAYLPKILKITIKIEKWLENFNKWAFKSLMKKRK